MEGITDFEKILTKLFQLVKAYLLFVYVFMAYLKTFLTIPCT